MSEEAEAKQVLMKLIEDGVSASADTLAKVSHTAWSTQSVAISSETIEKVSSRLEQDGREHYGAFVAMSGAIFLLMFLKENGPDLSSAFLHGHKARAGATEVHDDICVAEIANIVIHAVANTLADACGMAFILSAPEMVIGTKTDLMRIAVDKLKTNGEKHAVMAYVHMFSEALSSDCTVLLLLSPSCHGTMLKALAR